MRADIAVLVTCESVAMLDGWTASRGARLEHHIATELGMEPRLAAFFVDAVASDAMFHSQGEKHVRGEQSQHSNHGGCNGWFEVSSDASCMRTVA